MRLSRVDFRGYKRLLDTGCNLDADLIALVGLNEAGKTSVLEALDWLSRGGELNPRKINRTVNPGFPGPMVTAQFVLEDSDKEALSDVDTAVEPISIRFSRQRDGTAKVSFDPPLARKPELARTALKLLEAPDLQQRLEGNPVKEALENVINLAKTGREWNEEDERQIRELTQWLEEPVTAMPKEGKDAEPIPQPPPESDVIAAERLRDWRGQMVGLEPEESASAIIEPRIPKFLLFSKQDRTLGFEYDLSRNRVNRGGKATLVPSDDVQNPDGGLVNLLRLGGTSIRELHELANASMPERTSKHVRKVNNALRQSVSAHWRQRDLQVKIEVSGTTLYVFIDEGDDTARLTDRSDGLRIFIALISFLAQHTNDPPPILLIDEADTHLHYDAQADLINYLLDLPMRTIYTTHSPGCLPQDLGTGIRVIRPHQDEATSELSNSFWENEQPGFTPLLFAMGAGAAAFSALRDAVFVEGPSDMMLLPTLIRLATEQPNLGYQIVPGIANFRFDKLAEPDLAAVNVAYLIDGDQGGGQHRSDLLKIQVPEERIIQLPNGMATEDLIAPEIYLSEINDFLAESQRVERLTLDQLGQDLDDGVTISKSIERALGGRAATPGKVAIAGRLLRRGEPIRLSAPAHECLREAHSKLQRIFKGKN